MSNIQRRAVLGAVTAGAIASAVPLSGFASVARGHASPLAGAPTDNGGLVYQTSFEDADTDWVSSDTSYSTEYVHTGQASLRLHRPDDDYHIVTGKTFPAVPGQEYLATAFIRTEGLNPGQWGGRFALEAYDANGTWLSGGYGTNVRSEEWTHSGLTYRCHPRAATLRLNVYLQRGVTGTAYYDDLVVAHQTPRVMVSQLVTPSYRGLLVPGDHDTVTVRTQVGLDDAVLSGHQLEVTLSGEAGNVVTRRVDPARATLNFAYPADGLEAGRYLIDVRLVATSTGEVVAAEHWNLSKLAKVPRDWIDRHGRLIRNGEPYFPIGCYEDKIDDRTVQQLAGTGFNTVLAYRYPDTEGLDLAAANDLSVIFSLKDFFYDSGLGAKPPAIVTVEDEVPVITEWVERYRGHPAILAWYLCDELDLTFYGDRLADHHNAVVDSDDRHPTYTVHPYRADPPGIYSRCVDVFGNDPYPIGNPPRHEIGHVTTMARAAIEDLPSRGLWHVPQMFGWNSFVGAQPGPFPTADEFRNMTWQYLTEGATGLVFYALYKMRDNPELTFDQCMARVQPTVSQIAALVPVLLSVDPAPSVDAPELEWLNVATKMAEGHGYLFTVNHAREPRSATFTVPGITNLTELALSGPSQSVPVEADGTVTLDFAPLAVRLFRFTATWEGISAVVERYLSEGGASAALVGRATNALLRAQSCEERGQLTLRDRFLAQYDRLIADEQGRSLTADQVETLARLFTIRA